MVENNLDRNPYRNWTYDRLIKHQEQIAEVLRRMEQKYHQEQLAADNTLSPATFSIIHSEPGCQVIPVKVGEKDVPWNRRGDTIHLDYYAFGCTFHLVRSLKFTVA
jgi:hypothetical protein